MLSLGGVDIQMPPMPWQVAVTPEFQSIANCEPVAEVFKKLAGYVEMQRRTESFIQLTSFVNDTNIGLKRQTSDIRVNSLVDDTFGVAVKWQPREFVFAYGAPELSVQYVSTSRQISWFQDALSSASKGDEDAALTFIAYGTTEIKTNQEELERLSDELDQLDLSKLSDIILVSLLRNTYSFRSNLGSWSRLLDKTEQILQSRGQPVRSLLRGLRT